MDASRRFRVIFKRSAPALSFHGYAPLFRDLGTYRKKLGAPSKAAPSPRRLEYTGLRILGNHEISSFSSDRLRGECGILRCVDIERSTDMCL